MRFFDLPDVLIDYIYSFDDNYYYRKIYRNTLTQMLTIRARFITNMYLSSFHYDYNTYNTFMTVHSVRERLSISQYILEGYKHLGIQIVLDMLPPRHITKAKYILPV
jgi:hypothetical protein